MRITSPRRRKRLLVVAAIVAVAVFLGFLYAVLSLQALILGYTAPVYPGVPSITAQVFGSHLLYYNMSSTLTPYLLLHYGVANVSDLLINASMYAVQAPGRVYVLNTSGGLCTHCANVTAMESYLQGYLSGFGMSPNVTEINMTSLASLPGYSVLVLPTGRLPQQLLGTSGGAVLLDSLLTRGTSIIYVGMNFSQVCALGTCTVLMSPPVLESYLLTRPATYNWTGSKTSAFNFNGKTFAFTGGQTFGPLTYINEYNGSIVAFSNYPDSWPPKQEAFDIAKAISEEFWVPRYAQGSAVVHANGSSGGTIGMVLNLTQQYRNESTLSPSYLAGLLSSSHVRVTLYDNASYGVGNRSAYAYLGYQNSYPVYGTISMPPYVLPGQNVGITATLFYTALVNGSTVSIRVNNATDFRFLLSNTIHGFTAAQGQPFSFDERFMLPPGSYILSLLNLTNSTYASGLFTVPPLNITAISSDFQGNNYSFSVRMANIPLSGIQYTVRLDGCTACPAYSGVLPPNGTAFYTPQGAHTNEMLGQLNFTFSMLGSSFTYSVTNSPLKIVVTGPEVELAIVVVIMLVLVIAVKAPNRDEFFIDVPVMPKPETIEVKLRPEEVLSAFGKLNMYYHWQYMPLSIEEVKNAIRMNIRVGSMPVTVTYNNAESVLNELHSIGEVVSCDNLYAPKEWVSASGHGIEYLATFKKLRVWFVTHAYMFTDVNASDLADIVVTSRGERAYVIIYSGTSKFKAVPFAGGVQTYVAFINAEKLMEFRDGLNDAEGNDAELLRMYIASGRVRLLDADNPAAAFAS